MKFVYKNSRGEELNLSEWPYSLQSENIVDYEWSYENITYGLEQSKITHFYKKITEIPVELAVYSDNKEEYVRAMNHFFEVVEYDVANTIPGQLYSNDSCYLNCYILGSEKQHWKKGIRLNWYTLTVVAENPSWVIESKKSYEVSFEKEGGGLDYPYDYLYDFSSKVISGTLENKGHLPMDFRMIIYGPTVNPEIAIGDNKYKVMTEIGAGEYLVIDSQKHLVAQYDNVGRETNKYNARDKEHEIFSQIPSGMHSVVWDGAFGFDVITYIKRSEPEWIL